MQTTLAKLNDAGHFYKATYTGFYSAKEETFLTEKDRRPDGTFDPSYGPGVVQFSGPAGVTTEAGWLFITKEGAADLSQLLGVVHFLGDNSLLYGLEDGTFPYTLGTLPGPGASNYAFIGLYSPIPVPGVQGALWEPLTGQPGFLTGSSTPPAGDTFAYGFVVPEPASLALLGAGLLGLGAARRRARQG